MAGRMRMRQSLADLETAFYEGIEEDREKREQLARRAMVRSHRRQVEQTHRRGRMRFFLLVLTLLGTAALVTYAMFQALYIVMG